MAAPEGAGGVVPDAGGEFGAAEEDGCGVGLGAGRPSLPTAGDCPPAAGAVRWISGIGTIGGAPEGAGCTGRCELVASGPGAGAA